jgi:uridine kinase
VQPADQIASKIKELFAGAERPVVVAIDGRSGVGKSTIAKELAAKLEAALIDGDDFYAGGSEAEWDARSAAEKASLCIDWRRLRKEALEPLIAGKDASWHPYDFETGAIQAPHTKTANAAKIIILDGVYSGRPELADLIDLAVFVDLEDKDRRERLVERESEDYVEEWMRRWSEAEEYYFANTRAEDSFDLVISNATKF